MSKGALALTRTAKRPTLCAEKDLSLLAFPLDPVVRAGLATECAPELHEHSARFRAGDR